MYITRRAEVVIYFAAFILCACILCKEFGEVLLIPFDYLTSICQEVFVLILADFGSRHDDVAGCVALLVELPCFS